MPGCKEIKLRRFALQVAQQLPPDKDEAMKILAYAREVVTWENGEKLKNGA